MVRQPRSLDEAKQIYREEKAKVTRSFDALIGSRILMAVLATFAIAFAVNLWTSPDQLPNVGGLSLATYGLPDSVDFGFAGEQAREGLDAAKREGLDTEVSRFLDDNRHFVWLMNAGALVLTVALLLWNMTVMTRRRPYTKG
ncbi:MAG: hypothetical protein AB7G05_02020 [Hyphomonadaceae bacterium]